MLKIKYYILTNKYSYDKILNVNKKNTAEAVLIFKVHAGLPSFVDLTMK